METSVVDNRTTIEVPLSPPTKSVLGNQRPHTKKDDSTHDVDGAKQVSINQICTMNSVEWGEAFVKMQGTNSAQTLTMVSLSNLNYHK